MPPKMLFDLSAVNLNDVQIPKSKVYEVNPHRYEFQLLDGVFCMDHEQGIIVGYHDTKSEEFWVRGHIPGRPIFPGVLMIETAAQLVSYYAMTAQPGRGFLGFAGIDGVKFRSSVTPGHRIIMLGKMIELRPRRCVGATQAFVDGEMIYEGIITGMWI